MKPVCMADREFIGSKCHGIGSVDFNIVQVLGIQLLHGKQFAVATYTAKSNFTTSLTTMQLDRYPASVFVC